MSTAQVMLSGWLALAIVMALLWLLQYFTRNAGIVDVAWAFGTGILAVWLASSGQADVPERGFLIAALAGLWSLRLGVYLGLRVARESEDGRYRHMREALGRWAQPVMFLFFQIQALWGLLFALPMWAAAQSPSPALSWHDWIGIAIWLVAVGGEMLADAQLNRFRRNPENHGKVCRTGLWRYSRHPNYFFEWLHWLAYVFIGMGSSWWWVTIAGLVVMYVFLTRITGIPHTEQQALRSRGEAYRRYQASTSVFFPLPPSRTV